MIEVITGLPGNAKTLHALGLVIRRAKAENRPVYYANLKEFKNDDPRLQGTTWIEFDPAKWHEEVPSGSIILIDEAQKIFRNRSLGTVPGKHVTELEEHRHKGLDFYMITQHPSLIDPAIRKLTQSHRHMVRIWGMEASTVHKWSGIKENCDKPGGRADSEKSKWVFEKNLYGLYHSADQHTMKKSVPTRVWLLLGLIVALLAVGYYITTYFKKQTTVQSTPATSSGTVGQSGQAGAAAGQPGGAVLVDPMADLQQYVFKETPRVSGLPHTAPKYDQITEPVRAPVPSMCVQVGNPAQRRDVQCKCYTQQGTPMAVEFNMCIEFARNGYFQDFDAERDRRMDHQAAQGQAVLASRPDQPIRSGSNVVAFAKVPDDVPRVQGASRN